VWGVNGVGLALVLPNTQSLIADLFPAARRGRALGLLYLTAALGGMLGALYATNLGGWGWRGGRCVTCLPFLMDVCV
jgi:MFS family permease